MKIRYGIDLNMNEKIAGNSSIAYSVMLTNLFSFIENATGSPLAVFGQNDQFALEMYIMFIVCCNTTIRLHHYPSWSYPTSFGGEVKSTELGCHHEDSSVLGLPVDS